MANQRDNGENNLLGGGDPAVDRPLVVLAANRDWSVSLIELLQTRFRVVLAASGVEAAEQIADLRPRLLITSTTLPDEEGLALCRRLRADAKLRSISIAMLDDGRTSLNEPDLLAAGVNRLVAWPGDQDQLFAALEALARVAARRDARLMVRMDVEMDHGVGTTVGFSHNLSVSGMLLEGELDPCIGARLGLRFAVPNYQRELCPTAVVVRVQANAIARTQFAVRYIAIADEERRAIVRFVDNGRRLGLRRP